MTDVALFRDAYGPLLRGVLVADSPDARRAEEGETAADYAQRAARRLEALLQDKADRIAAVIVEPLVQCATGMAMYDASYLAALRKLCDQYEVHMIADEIAVGFGRTGTFFACEQAKVWPDFLCLSKGISGGYLPLSLVMTRDHIYEAFYGQDIKRAFLHSHSYTGNPLACRAALATLKIFDDDDVLQANKTLAQRISAALAPLRDHPRVRHFRQCGMIWAFDAVLDEGDTDFASRFFTLGLQHQLLLRPIGNTVYLMPPYVLTEADIEHLAVSVKTVFELALGRRS